MNFMWAGYEIINITCLVGIKGTGDPCAQHCSNLQADETANNEGFTYGESLCEMSTWGSTDTCQ